jgi:glycosyltransferase involved in cell wall biosynthesis
MAEKKKKILYVITKSNWGGAQKYVYDLATSFQDKFDVVVALGGSGEKDAEGGILKRRLNEKGVRTLFVKNFLRDISFIREIKALFELSSIMKNERPDIVHLNSSKAGWIGTLSARLARVKKIIFTAHGWPFKEDRNFFFKYLAKIGSKHTARLADKIVVVSQEDYEIGKKQFPFAKEKLIKIYNGIKEIPIKDFYVIRKEFFKILGKELPMHTILIGTIGELSRNKGIIYGIRTLKELEKIRAKEKLGGIFYIIIGSGEEKKRLKKEVGKLGLEDRVMFHDFIPNVTQYMQAFDIILIPSLKEGMPYTLLEAGIVGRPVVATDIGGIKEVLQDGETGRIVESKNPKALAEGILDILNKKIEGTDYGLVFRERIEKNFPLEQMITETERLYLL